jgi:multiple sugar transport system substrate-binding protein
MTVVSRRSVISGAGAAIVAGSALLKASSAKAANVSLKVSYAGPILRVVHEGIVERFSKLRADISVSYNPPVRSYEELIQQVLRGSIVGDMPDIAFHTLGSNRIFAARSLAAPMDAFIAKEKNFEQLGYLQTMIEMGKLNGKTLCFPFEVSAPVAFYNLSLVKQAGGDPGNLPTSWEGIIDLMKKIGGLGNNTTGGHFEYDQSGAWMLQALVMSQGGRMLNNESTAIAFDNEIGVEAFRVLQSLGSAGMVDMSRDQARQVFSSGKLGVLITANSILNALESQALGKFEVGISAFPIPSSSGVLPAGGNAAVIHAKDPARIEAAWEYIKFAAGPVGQAISIKNTGYLPVNNLALAQKDIVGAVADNKNFQNAVRLLPRLAAPTEFPGENAIKITGMMKDRMQSVVTLKAEPRAALRDMTNQVNAILKQ